METAATVDRWNWFGRKRFVLITAGFITVLIVALIGIAVWPTGAASTYCAHPGMDLTLVNGKVQECMSSSAEGSTATFCFKPSKCKDHQTPSPILDNYDPTSYQN